ncbi:MAG: hypothetical protein KAQ67_03465, partial [Gammaproteobacteria bacterium]|nr:hypothetical protein [Gammaproteobacteria bacterium]
MSWCFYRVSKFRLRLAQIIGFYFLLSLFVQVLTGMLNANTTVIMQQSLISWIVIAELLFFTWALHFYYQYFDLQGAGKKMAMILHKSVFYVPVGLLVLSLIQISMQNIAEQKQMEFGYLWLDFIIIGALLLTGRWLLNKENSLQDNELSLRHKYILSETGSLYLTVFFLYTVAILFQEWMFNAAAIPLLFLLHRSVKEKLPLTEKLAWAHFLLFAVMTWLSYQTVGNLHFSEQSWSTQIAWGELLLCAWAMQMVYERSGSKEGTYDLAVKLRIAVYLLIPLLFLPRALRLYAEYLPVFIWASFAISWFMYKKLKIETLLKQLTVLFFVAVITTVLMALNAISGAQQLPGLAALITGVIVISFFHYIEKTIHQKSQNLTLYKSIQLSSPYFYAFALAAFTYALTNLVTLSLLITAVFFLLSIQGKKVRVVMRETIRVAYLLVWAGFVSVLVLVYLQVEKSYLVIPVDLLALAGLWYISHRREAVLQIMQRRHMAQNVQFWVFHALVFITYTGVLNLAFDAWSVGTSIAMLMHA